MKQNNLPSNTFFDINKLPLEKGLLLFPISMSRIRNRQSAESLLEDIRHFSPSKVSKPLIGLNVIYGDFLYLYSDKPAPELKNSFMKEVINHKNGMQKLIEKNFLEFQIQHAFNYMVWNQLYVGTNDFSQKFTEIKRLYAQDRLFQKYIQEDCGYYGRPMEENQINFFLEEHLMQYLLVKGQIKLPNEYIQNQEKWILFCYPGNPPKASVYLFQLNPFNLNNSDNLYQNAEYNLETKKLIDFTRVDLDTYEY